MKPLFPTLAGNDRQKTAVGTAILRGTLSHAYLIQGPAGCGKRTFARLVAAALLCQAQKTDGVPLPCGECPACRKVLATGSPDLTVLSRGENATIGVEAVRRMKDDMYLAPAEFDRKIYLVEEAEKMTPAAQNALLIALEEPPRQVMIFLLCTDASAMLPTVRSRVQVWSVTPFSRDALEALLLRRDTRASALRRDDPAAFRTLIAAAEGSPGRALSLLERKELKAAQDLRACVTELLSAVQARAGYARLQSVAAALPAKRPELLECLRLCLAATRDMILLKRDENAPLCFFADREDARARSESYGLRCLFSVSEALSDAMSDLNRNANVSVVLACLTDRLWHAPTK